MSNIYVISDLHLNHTNMSIRRGFDSVDDHDNHIIDSWNSVIHKKDTVWVLGDITMEKVQPYELLNRLNGIKNIVLGNHDKPNHTATMLNYVNKVCGCYKYDKCILTHIPVHPNELIRYKYNIHGHVHTNSLDDKRYINVSCEVLDYKPVRLDELTK